MIAGIDVSTKAVDIVLLNESDDGATWARFELAPGGAHRAAASLRDFSPSLALRQSVYLIGIEDPHSRFPHVAKALGLVTGALLMRLPAATRVIWTRPNEWKQLTCGKATSSKEEVAAAAHRYMFHGAPGGFAYIDWPQDALDAYCIAYAVRKLNADAIEAA